MRTIFRTSKTNASARKYMVRGSVHPQDSSTCPRASMDRPYFCHFRTFMVPTSPCWSK